MKKALIASLLGIALNVTSSHAQGYIVMENYKVVGTTHRCFRLSLILPGGQYVSAASGFKADQLFSLMVGSRLTWRRAVRRHLGSNSGTPTTDGAGTFVGLMLRIPGYTQR